MLDLLKESGAFCGIVAELVTENAKSAGRVIKAPRDLLRSDVFNKIASQGFVLAVDGIFRREEEIRFGGFRYPISSTDRHIVIML